MIKGKLLIVDDKKSIRDIFINTFEEYLVVAVGSGNEALQILRAPHDIDLVVLDVMLPDVTGIDVLREIRRINPLQKVVMLTAYDSKGVIIDALRARADEFIEKPFDVEATKKIFERLLEKTNADNPEETNRNESKIRWVQRMVKRNYQNSIFLKDISKQICLSPKYLSRLFKQKTGKSFNEYKLALRMNEAKKLLTETDSTISQIAYKVGYQTPESFIKMFRKFVGTVPSRYRGY